MGRSHENNERRSGLEKGPRRLATAINGILNKERRGPK